MAGTAKINASWTTFNFCPVMTDNVLLVARSAYHLSHEEFRQGPHMFAYRSHIDTHTRTHDNPWAIVNVSREI